jgi:hypothetical protein
MGMINVIISVLTSDDFFPVEVGARYVPDRVHDNPVVPSGRSDQSNARAHRAALQLPESALVFVLCVKGL